MPRDNFVIDPAALDKELILQPQLTRNAGRAEADARHEHAQAKARLDVVSARLGLAIRQSPAAYKLRDKPNNDEVSACLVLQPEYVTALEVLNDAKYGLDILQADTYAMIDRRKCLERYVELIALDYFSERQPNPSGEKARDDARDRVRRATMEVGDGS